MTFQLLSPAFWAYKDVETAVDYSAGYEPLWDVEHEDTLDGHTLGDEDYVVPASMDGKSAFVRMTVALEFVSTSGTKLIQLYHKDACAATKNFVYRLAYQALSDFHTECNMFCPVVNTGDIIYGYFDPGSDTSHNVPADGGGINMQIIFMDPIGTDVGPQYTG